MKFSINPQEGFTRLCLDPWAKAFIRADGKVCLCCNAPPVDIIGDKSLVEILDGENTRRYRLGLLTGNLMPACQICPDRQVVPLQEEENRVRQYINTGKMDVF